MGLDARVVATVGERSSDRKGYQGASGMLLTF